MTQTYTVEPRQKSPRVNAFLENMRAELAGIGVKSNDYDGEETTEHVVCISSSEDEHRTLHVYRGSRRDVLDYQKEFRAKAKSGNRGVLVSSYEIPASLDIRKIPRGREFTLVDNIQEFREGSKVFYEGRTARDLTAFLKGHCFSLEGDDESAPKTYRMSGY